MRHGKRKRLCRRSLALESLEARAMLHGTASISGFVYLDADADGTLDTGEIGVPGVVVRLEGTGTAEGAVQQSSITDNSGKYTFAELEAGSYAVTQRQSTPLIDGMDTTPVTAAVKADDAFSNIALTDGQTLENNNFGERGLRAEFININWFLASTPPVPEMLRATLAMSEEMSGNMELAQAIRSGSGTIPDDDDDDDDDSDDDDGGTSDQLFPAVTPGSHTDAGVRGVRTDTQAGAPAVTQTHVTTAVDYSAYTQPPSYGPHHAVKLDNQGNSITPRPTGVYQTEQPDEDLVHNLEHGHVWISYDPALITPADKTALEQLVINGGTNTGVIMTPRAANTSAIVLTSWGRQLTMNSFDAATVRDFIVNNRGKAPEGFIPSGQKPAGVETFDDGLPHTPPPSTPNQPFPTTVTPGSHTDANLRGVRTDTQAGAPAVTQTHVTTSVDYSGYTQPPSYGPHHAVKLDDQGNSITPRPTGVYQTEQPDEDLVHNLEHGHVWISYDPALISPSDKAALEQLVIDGGTNTGVIMTPRAANTSAIVLTSWGRQLTMNSFNAATVRDFIITNRGKSPEGFIPSGQKPAGVENFDDGWEH